MCGILPHNRRNDVTDKGQTVSIRIHPTNKAIMETIATDHRIATTKGLTNDEILFEALSKKYPDAVKRVLDSGAEHPLKKKAKGE